MFSDFLPYITPQHHVCSLHKPVSSYMLTHLIWSCVQRPTHNKHLHTLFVPLFLALFDSQRSPFSPELPNSSWIIGFSLQNCGGCGRLNTSLKPPFLYIYIESWTSSAVCTNLRDFCTLYSRMRILINIYFFWELN